MEGLERLQALLRGENKYKSNSSAKQSNSQISSSNSNSSITASLEMNSHANTIKPQESSVILFPPIPESQRLFETSNTSHFENENKLFERKSVQKLYSRNNLTINESIQSNTNFFINKYPSNHLALSTLQINTSLQAHQLNLSMFSNHFRQQNTTTDNGLTPKILLQKVTSKDEFQYSNISSNLSLLSDKSVSEAKSTRKKSSYKARYHDSIHLTLFSPTPTFTISHRSNIKDNISESKKTTVESNNYSYEFSKISYQGPKQKHYVKGKNAIEDDIINDIYDNMAFNDNTISHKQSIKPENKHHWIQSIVDSMRKNSLE